MKVQSYSLPSSDECIVLLHDNKKYLVKFKESLLFMHGQSILNKNISSVVLNLFDRV